jgi:hypothetical protein
MGICPDLRHVEQSGTTADGGTGTEASRSRRSAHMAGYGTAFGSFQVWKVPV